MTKRDLFDYTHNFYSNNGQGNVDSVYDLFDQQTDENKFFIELEDNTDEHISYILFGKHFVIRVSRDLELSSESDDIICFDKTYGLDVITKNYIEYNDKVKYNIPKIQKWFHENVNEFY